MYKFAISICCVTIALLTLYIYPCRMKDYALYEELLKKGNQEKKEDLYPSTKQVRGQVRKQVWYQGATPLQIWIDSPESQLYFSKQKGQIEVIEHLGHVICIMQEELYFVDHKPMQKIRYLEAERASYNYNNHLFIAEEAKLWKYQMEGHSLPKQKPDLPSEIFATAESVAFSLQGEKLDFIAHHMRAAVNTQKSPL
jgi:hypothetical protein